MADKRWSVVLVVVGLLALLWLFYGQLWAALVLTLLGLWGLGLLFVRGGRAVAGRARRGP
jgi:hypothetical protein